MIADRATVEVERAAASPTDRFRSYVVYIDAAEHGRLRHGERKRFELTPGHHRLQLKIDWARSPTIDLDLAPGETTRSQCKSRATNALTGLYWASIGRDRYIELWPVESPDADDADVHAKHRTKASRAASALLLPITLIAVVIIVAAVLQWVWP